MSNRYTSMEESKLKELSKQKNKSTGCFTKEALAAQRELWTRNHWNTMDPGKLKHIDEYADRDLNDLQYNG